MANRGRPIKTEQDKKSAAIVIRLTKDEHDRIREAAQNNNMPVSMLVRTGLTAIGAL